ncbi:uncharacterized protein LOC135477588 [Liolophura sinensis]|uniref:uncharacterized protein LOC135477588 n=1 Tax=Liolophura sinensis TaxID=3198878 RepID=UPI003158713F
MDVTDHTYSVLSGSLCGNESPSQGCPQMEKFSHVITTFMKEQGIPGASVAISKNGQLVYKQGYGISGAGRRVQSDSLFRIASISKSLTAICILRLYEEKKLGLDATVFGHKGVLSWYRPSGKGDKRLRLITVRHLLQHSAGWDRDQVGDPVFWRLEKITGHRGPTKTDELISYMMTRKLQFSPGKRHSYSNFGYLVLGAIIEAVTGTSYEEYVTQLFSERGFSPMKIGREKKDVEQSDEVEYFHNQDPVVYPSIFEEDGLVSPPYGSFAMTGTGAYGGWVTSAPVLISVVNSLEPGAGNSILTADSLRQMFARPNYESSVVRSWYGLGWDIQDAGGSWGHTGAMEGTSCTVMRHQCGLSWAVLFNAWAKDMDIDGMIKYGLSYIDEWPLWQPRLMETTGSPTQIVSADSEEVVGVLIPLTDVKQHNNKMRSWGYSPKNINALSDTNDVFFNIVWRKSLHSSYLLSHVPCQDLKTEVTQGKEQGYSVDLMEAYDYRGETFLALNFEKMIADVNKLQIIYCDKAASEHEALRASYQKDGFLLVGQSVISQDGVPKVSAVFNKVVPTNTSTAKQSPVQRSFYRITPCNFTYELGRFGVNLGSFELTYLKFYNDVDNVSVSAVWTSQKANAACKQQTSYYHRQDVSLYGFLYEMRESAANNLRTRFVCSYKMEGVINFAVIWQGGNVEKLS